jgi:hypothetical protein
VTITHPLDFFLMILALICLAIATFAPYAVTAEPARRVWLNRWGWGFAGLFLWALTVFLGYAGIR